MLQAILTTVVPVFTLILLGYGAARARLIDTTGVKGINAFVYLFAIPALLFRTVHNLDVAATAPWPLWGAFFLSLAVVWVLAIVISPNFPSLAAKGGASAAIGSTFGNLVMMGIPLSAAHWGPAALVPAALIVAVHAPLHWFFATLRAEWADRSNKSLVAGMVELFTELAKNPIVMALVAGHLWRLTGIGISPIADKTISLLGQAGIPASLFGLGLSLAAYGLKGHLRGMTAILVLKMMVAPLIATVMALWVFRLDPLSAGVVILFASLPPGANAYLFASRYNTGVAPVSGAIALGVLLSVFSVSIVLWLIG